MNRDTKIKVFNACVKSVLLYGCETWLVTNELRRKILTFIDRCLRYMLRIWWPRTISNRELWPNRYKYGDKETRISVDWPYTEEGR
jgi:hypothetical protein